MPKSARLELRGMRDAGGAGREGVQDVLRDAHGASVARIRWTGSPQRSGFTQPWLDVQDARVALAV